MGMVLDEGVSNHTASSTTNMTRSVQLGIDSQCLSYVIDAMASVSPPTDVLSEQKIALLRLFFYLPNTLWVTPTVTQECARIRNIERAALHQSFINVLFGELQLKDASEVHRRGVLLCKYHSDQDDCSILAEAEDVGHNVLLSFDNDFIRRLTPQSRNVKLMRPADYWTQIQVPRGTKPDKIPDLTNPLCLEEWWRW
jgi:hypothetical protein